MPIQNGKYINPGWVDNAPPAIDAAELNAISDTLENLDAGGGGGDGKRYARMVIGTSTAGWTAEDCDYLCDGVDDQIELNAAIAAIGSQKGSIVVLAGTYNLTAPLTFLNGIDLIGMSGVTFERHVALPYNNTAYLVGIGNATIRNIYFDAYDAPGTDSGITAEVALASSAQMESCDVYAYRNIGVLVEGSNVIIPARIEGNYFFHGPNPSDNSCDIYVQLTSHIVIVNNRLDIGITVKSDPDSGINSGTNLSSFTISGNCSNTGRGGIISIDDGQNGTIYGNVIREIKILNTLNNRTFGGNVIFGNRCNPQRDGQVLITLGENTSGNLVYGNNLAGSLGDMGTIQDNGENNIINNGFSGGQATLTASGWSANRQTVSAPGVTASSYVTVGPASTTFNAAMEAGVYCSGQGDGTLTFTCTTTPSSSITYTYTTQEVF